ncbi:MAG: Pyrrolo-quinoline quinone [bacterium]|nr:Pyrrolo-quinoline quinone [bacterium]
MRWIFVATIFVVGGCHSSASQNTMDLSIGDGDGGGGGGGGLGGGDLGDPGPDMTLPIGASVLQLHNHASRDGVYVQPTFTTTAIAQMHQDPGFDGTYAQSGASGAAYAQPLFVDQGGTNDLVIVATEKNYVLAFDAVTGKTKWHTDPTVLGAAAPGNAFACGNIDPSGITGTPVIDMDSRAIIFQTDAFAGITDQHHIQSQ